MTDILDQETAEIDVQSASKTGVELCRAGKWQEGMAYLAKVTRRGELSDTLPGEFYTFLGYGLARYKKKHREGLKLCRYGVKKQPHQPDNYLNLARVYVLQRNRRLAVKSLERGMAVDSSHAGLREFRDEIGYRLRPVIGFLPRKSAINKWLGKRRYRRMFPDRVQEDED